MWRIFVYEGFAKPFSNRQAPNPQHAKTIVNESEIRNAVINFDLFRTRLQCMYSLKGSQSSAGKLRGPRETFREEALLNGSRAVS